MAKLYALLVGVNTYHPDSGVNSLEGCENDVNAMKAFLVSNFPHLLSKDPEKGPAPEILTLTNENATRKAVLEGFKSHLQKAGKDDVALFYYSGHGSFENTSPEFEAYDSKNQNETLICHDSRLPKGYDLADKELAVLISRIDNRAKKVIILDSCHSGSATRGFVENEFGLSRQEPARRDANYKRPLDSYLLPGDDYYTSQAKEAGGPKIPLSPHILLSACDRDELALETGESRRGLFSTHLISTLEKNNSRISYNELFLQIRESVHKENPNQSPRVDPIGGFNSNHAFFSSNPVEEAVFPVTGSDDGGWKIPRGAVHGMPTDVQDISGIKLALYSVDKNGKEISAGECGISSVEMENSILDVKDLKSGQTYKAKLTDYPLKKTLGVWLNGSKVMANQFLKAYKNAPSAYLNLSNSSSAKKYELRLANEEIMLYHIPSGILVQGVKSTEDWAVEHIVSVLNKIEKWERIRNLEKKPDSLPKDCIEFTFDEIDQSMKVVKNYEGNNIRLDFNREKNGWEAKGIRIKGKKTVQDPELYVLVLYFSQDFAIERESSVELDKMPYDKEINLYFGGESITNPANSEEEVMIKILVSTQEINPAYYNQEKIEIGKVLSDKPSKTRGKVSWGTVEPTVDWFTQSYTILLRGNEAQIGNKEIEKNGLSVSAHGSFEAKLSFGSINSMTRSVSNIHKIASHIQGSGIEIFDLSATNGKTRSAESNKPAEDDKSIVVLTDISGDRDLEKNPLEITLDSKLASNEYLLPVTHDGEFILPFGDIQLNKEGKPVLTIDHLPAQQDPQTRNVKKALKFVFLKVIFGKKASVFKLRWVDYASKEKDKRTDKDLLKKVASAKKVLLMIHGIIGDTKTMIPKEDFTKKNGKYDLVLTFDYENLDEPIDEISRQLFDQLKKASFKANDNTVLHIVAHSMGGLVARHMIEYLPGASDLVDRLIMFGTPNGGSLFGKMPDILKRFSFLTGIALNLLPGFVQSALSITNELLGERKPKLLNTLSMMDPSHDFIINLTKSKSPGVEYFIVAGDISTYKAGDSGGGTISKLLEKLQLGLGKMVYVGKSNDIAVGVPEILDVPFKKKENTRIISCHHLNYFINEDSLKSWEKFTA